MRRFGIPMVLATTLLAGCASHREKTNTATLAELHEVRPDLQEVTVEHGIDQAMEGYRRFLEETPGTEMTPEAMRRLADLQLEKQFGIRTGDGKPREMPAPVVAPVSTPDEPHPDATGAGTGVPESDEDFERRTTAERGLLADLNPGAWPAGAAPLNGDPNGPIEAIALYDRLIAEYPSYAQNDQVLYQKARAYDELGRTEEALATMEELLRVNPNSTHFDEVQFRRGEFFFMRRRYRDAETAYSALVERGNDSEYYQLGLYKLGWTLYKQERYEEALHKYMALLDDKVATGYNFDESHAEDDEKRVADTHRVISLSFSNLGGAEAVREYFSTFGHRDYEDRVYANLGEHYLIKLRYDDAAKAFNAFVDLYPLHKAAPHFSMRVIDTFTQGGFPMLVLEAKRDFAATYGLQAEYWRHFKPEESPAVLAYLKTNLRDLASHYHARYQGTQDTAERVASYGEARRWYGDYLASFPTDPDAPTINYQLADLLFENKDFGEAAREYERAAYDYPAHPRSAEAGYAAVYAHREHLSAVGEELGDAVKRDTVASSIRFVDAFPQHEKAAPILEAAAADLYEMKDYKEAVGSAQRLVDAYPAAENDLRLSAWIIVAHGSFELAEFARAESAYTEVLNLTPEGDASRAGFVDNLAASIYKQGEIARDARDLRAAADHFLRIRTVAPTSSIRSAAEYDAGTALMGLQDWSVAAGVLEEFRDAYPDHELRREATRQIAFAYKESGELSRAAGEYDRLASDSEDPAVRGEALLVAGDLYQQSHAPDRALDVYTRYVNEFPSPIETALETRFKISEIYKATLDESLYRQALIDIVALEAAAPESSPRTRTIAARSALVLAEEQQRAFTAVKLTQPFEASLEEKKRLMDIAVEAMERLVDYEIADVTAAATFYLAEAYFDFSQALIESERPNDLTPEELEEYALGLEDEAFPFEEKAIEFHVKNQEMLQAGVLNEWTEKSLGRLVELMPGRYARNEMSSGFLGAIGVYLYQAPAAQLPGPISSLNGSRLPKTVQANAAPTGRH